MNEIPEVSFVVLSYNNARFIRQTIDSILNQSFSDFEVVIIDDASTDEFVEIVRSYADRRIQLFVHDRNLGLTPSYNEAITKARGNFIVNLDSDDAIDPTKTAKQITAFERDPALEVVGTYIKLIDENNNPHANSDLIEGIINKQHNFNLIRSWVVQNSLVRSSTMMRRSLHERVGLNEIGMVRAPDYDLWTRGLRSGCQFHLIPEPLTHYRQHSRGLTYGDPHATFLELSYSVVRHLVPLIDERADYGSLASAMNWMVENEQFIKLNQAQRYRLLALVMQSVPVEGYEHFRAIIKGASDSKNLVLTGRRALALQKLNVVTDRCDFLAHELKWYMQQTENWTKEFEYAKAQAQRWEQACHAERSAKEILLKERSSYRIENDQLVSRISQISNASPKARIKRLLARIALRTRS